MIYFSARLIYYKGNLDESFSFDLHSDVDPFLTYFQQNFHPCCADGIRLHIIMENVLIKCISSLANIYKFHTLIFSLSSVPFYCIMT